jgi:RNA polymerase sigma-70 factor (ECF subfamily)
MSASVSAPAYGTDFELRTDPFRRELLAHCYRMLGSVTDAEDLVQETYLRAWRSYGGFEGRSSIRTWLYRIATNACLRALEQRHRRPLPSGLGAPSNDPGAPVVGGSEVPWLQPIPDVLFATNPVDPAAAAASRSHLRLALVAALQLLPARQRAVLILRDVLAWRAAEVAELLDTTVAAVNSALQRAHAQLATVAPVADLLAEPADAGQRAALDRYVHAFENGDVGALTRLLRSDAILEMPPHRTWFQGRETIGRFLAPRIAPAGDMRLVPVGANGGQPAAGLYQRGADGSFRPHAIHLLTVAGSDIVRISAFLDPGPFASFGLPPTL